MEKRPCWHVRITGTQQIHVEELCILYLYGNVRCHLHQVISIRVIAKAKWWIISERKGLDNL